MDREVIEQKLESLRRCLMWIGEKCPDMPDVLATDPAKQSTGQSSTRLQPAT